MGKTSNLLTSVQKALQGADLRAAAEATDISTRQLRNLRDGTTVSPRWDTITKLAAFFKIKVA